MKFSAAAVAALVAGATASYMPAHNGTTPTKYTTTVVTAYTTYCPGPTTISYGDMTYTITSATTLTISDCPCTITKPVLSTPAPPAPPASTPVSPVKPPVAPPAPSSYMNGTTPAAPVSPTPAKPSASPIKTKPVEFTGAANQVVAASGAGLAVVFALAAYIL